MTRAKAPVQQEMFLVNPPPLFGEVAMKKLRPYTPPADASLSDVLVALGYRSENAGGQQGKRVLRGDTLAHTGTADSTWTWLRETGQIA